MPSHGLAARRLVVAALVGVAGGAVVWVTLGPVFAPVATWLVASVLYIGLTWIAIRRMDAATTAAHATREDPTAGAAHLVLLLSSLASLGGVVLLLVATGRNQDALAAALGAASVVASWFTVHTLYTLGYAAAYYGGTPGGIDFNQKQPPAYADFAYLGFTLGMTYQVSDTSIGDPVIRRLALRHALLSYVLGAVVLAITVNLVGNLAR